MSASGTGVFDDDVACDIRAQYRALLKDGNAPTEATRAVLRDWKPALGDAEDGPVIGWAPAVALLDWRGKRVPSAERIQSLPYKICTDDPIEKHSVFMFTLSRKRETDMPQDRVFRGAAMRPASHWKELVGLSG